MGRPPDNRARPTGSPRRPGAGTPFGYLPRFFIDWASDVLAASQALAAIGADLEGKEVRLAPEDSHHALRVLRLRTADECEVVVAAAPLEEGDTALRPAEGRRMAAPPAAYRGVVVEADKEVRVRLLSRLEGREAGAVYGTQVGVVQAFARPAVADFLLEKGTEVGAGFFFLLSADGSSRRAGSSEVTRMARWRRIAREAAKQSKHLVIPTVDVAESVAEVLERLGEDTMSLVLEPRATAGLYEVVSAAWERDEIGGVARAAGRVSADAGAPAAKRPARLALWVGPESGWTAPALERLAEAGAQAVRLGQGVLRTETAGPVAVAVTRLALRDW